MEVNISVRNLIEFVMRSGDIDNTFRDNNRAILGIRAHQKIQQSYTGNYEKEFFLKNTTEVDDMVFEVEGRADGILRNDNEVIVDEIKSTTRDINEISGDNKLHWAQAMCYAYFYCIDYKLDQIAITLTYINVDDGEKKIFRRDFEFSDLKEFYVLLLRQYIDFSKIITKNLSKRQESIKKLTFPYKGYRKGQRKLAVAVYTAILDNKKIFIDAPTGTGKTISTIFPAVKSLGEELSDKIFYITAKNTTAKEALKSIYKLRENGMYIKALSITSKEKICINDKVKCNPNDCPYAKGHFDRVNDALKDIISNKEIIDYDVILEYAKKYKVCPFEFELDISNYSDIIICDYNYVFDSSVYLRRFFDEVEEDYVILVDEAHNLVQRVRDSYSIDISRNNILEKIKIFEDKKYNKINKALDSIIESFDKVYRNSGKKLFYYTDTLIDTFDDDVIYLIKNLEKFLIKEKNDKDYDLIMDFYFELLRFQRIEDYFEKGFFNTISYDEENDDIIFSIKCVNPANVIKNRCNSLRTAVFFSATLSPMNYYIKLLGGEDSLKLHLDFPFDDRNLLILNSKISTRYNDRIVNISKISDLIYDFINSKKGNYFIYFPSYKYMQEVYEDYKRKYNTENILIQKNTMTEEERFEFLQEFTYDSEKTAFLVLGGIFSEGVDLRGDRLIASMIISVGTPGVSNERNLIKYYFDSLSENGFQFAYTYPGINKVFQAAGRVIRSEKDKGIVLLVDDRFSYYSYKKMYPRYWKNIIEIDRRNLNQVTKDFWEANIVKEEE
ncbi:MAG: ATP-dependent DNA helicase [Tissierellia bacterium]|nr:ATP-dependent DNA helicase [Tissierellia bacterium]